MASTYNPIQEEEDKKEQAQQGDFGPVQTIGTAGSSPSGAVAAPEKRQQGSGRFTNLQKYVKANQGAGQRIAGGIGEKVGGQLGKQQEQAQGYYSKLGKAISGAQKTAGEAADYTGQLKDIGTGIGDQTFKKIDYDSLQYQAPAQTWEDYQQNIQNRPIIDPTGVIAKDRPQIDPYAGMSDLEKEFLQYRTSRRRADIMRSRPTDETSYQAMLDRQRQEYEGDLKGFQSMKDAAEQKKFEDWQAGQATGLEGIEAFTSDEDKFKRFQDIQSGRAINEDLLDMRQKQAAAGAQEYLGQTQAAKEALGTESGRFDLLRETFGGANRPGYTTGQQRLDQLFLTRGGLGGLKQDVSGRAKAAAELAKQSGKALGTVQNLAQQERGYMGDIGTQTLANEQAYMDMLKSYIDPTNVGRQAEYDSLSDAFQSYLPQDPGTVQTAEYRPGFSAEEQERLGINRDQGVYNVFDQLSDVGQIATRGRDAFSAQDVAQEADVSRYGALAKMLGMDPSAKAITRATDIDPSYSAIEGEAGLAARLNKAEEEFREAAKGGIGGYTSTTAPDGNYWTSKELFRNTNPGSISPLYQNTGYSPYVTGVAESTYQRLLDEGRAGMDSSYGAGKYGSYLAKYGRPGPATGAQMGSIADTFFGGASHGVNSAMIDAVSQAELAASDQQYRNQYKDYLMGDQNQHQASQYTPGMEEFGSYIDRTGGALQQQEEAKLIDQFKKFIEQQNYGQTIGGRRSTFLDDEAAAASKNERLQEGADQTATPGKYYKT